MSIKNSSVTLQSPIGLALAGGGQMGIIYEVGALRALDEALDGIDFNALSVYVGVSAGAVVAANLANKMTTRSLCRYFINGIEQNYRFDPSRFFTPAFGEYVKRLQGLPGLFFETFCRFWDGAYRSSWVEALFNFSRSIPTALFNNDPIDELLEEVFRREGCTNDFRELQQKLFVVAVDIDSGESVLFGDRGHDHVPISRAVEASAALPGLYPPVEINGRYYVDGALVKTMHASVALDAGAKLVICLNPLVPFRSESPDSPSLAEQGLPIVMSQAFRTLLHSRMAVRLKEYKERYPDSDLILFEPRHHDKKVFFANDFAFSNRMWVCEHAYQTTRQDLLERSDELEPVLNRHGITLRRDVLEDKNRHFSMVLKK